MCVEKVGGFMSKPRVMDQCVLCPFYSGPAPPDMTLKEPRLPGISGMSVQPAAAHRAPGCEIRLRHQLVPDHRWCWDRAGSRLPTGAPSQSAVWFGPRNVIQLPITQACILCSWVYFDSSYHILVVKALEI